MLVVKKKVTFAAKESVVMEFTVAAPGRRRVQSEKGEVYAAGLRPRGAIHKQQTKVSGKSLQDRLRAAEAVAAEAVAEAYMLTKECTNMTAGNVATSDVASSCHLKDTGGGLVQDSLEQLLESEPGGKPESKPESKQPLSPPLVLSDIKTKFAQDRSWYDFPEIPTPAWLGSHPELNQTKSFKAQNQIIEFTPAPGWKFVPPTVTKPQTLWQFWEDSPEAKLVPSLMFESAADKQAREKRLKDLEYVYYPVDKEYGILDKHTLDKIDKSYEAKYKKKRVPTRAVSVTTREDGSVRFTSTQLNWVEQLEGTMLGSNEQRDMQKEMHHRYSTCEAVLSELVDKIAIVFKDYT